jgi:hypothetical protein
VQAAIQRFSFAIDVFFKIFYQVEIVVMPLNMATNDFFVTFPHVTKWRSFAFSSSSHELKLYFIHNGAELPAVFISAKQISLHARQS